MKTKFLVLFTCIIVALGLCGVTRSRWNDPLRMRATATTGVWKARVRIRTTIDGAYTDPRSGDQIPDPVKEIAVSAGFPTLFRFTIHVRNMGSTALEGVSVSDVIMDELAPRGWRPESGVTWRNHTLDDPNKNGTAAVLREVTWNIGGINPGEDARLVIWLETTSDPEKLFHPLAGDGEGKNALAFNVGSRVTARSPFSRLAAKARALEIIVYGDSVHGNGVAVIVTELPLSTPWAEDRYP